MKQYIIYQIYFGHRCVFIGITNIDLTSELRVKFFGQNAIDVSRVSKIEYAILPSMADCFVYQAYLINSIKPLYNKVGKARDVISQEIILPEVNFIEYNNPIVDKWKEMLKTEQIDLFQQFNI